MPSGTTAPPSVGFTDLGERAGRSNRVRVVVGGRTRLGVQVGAVGRDNECFVHIHWLVRAVLRAFVDLLG